MAAIKTKKRGSKIVFTSHGYHFFKGSGFFGWFFYYPLEKFMSFFTDVIVTINKEDYLVSKRHFGRTSVFLIPGMGVDNSIFYRMNEVQRAELRSNLGYKIEDFIVLIVGELNANKNQEFLLSALGEASEEFPHLKLIMIGKGPKLSHLRNLAERYNLDVSFLGWRDDVHKYAKTCDLGASASKREGLGIALIEQMLCGCPVIASNNRGHREIVDSGVNGYLFEQSDPTNFRAAFSVLYKDSRMRRTLGEEAHNKAQRFLIENSLREMSSIYQSL
jgi:glycosyltransferase EpsD